MFFQFQEGDFEFDLCPPMSNLSVGSPDQRVPSENKRKRKKNKKSGNKRPMRISIGGGDREEITDEQLGVDVSEPILPSDEEREIIKVREDRARRMEEGDEEENGNGDCPLCEEGDFCNEEHLQTEHSSILAMERQNYGDVSDIKLMECMVDRHREEIEEPLAEYGMEYKKWNFEIVRNHFKGSCGTIHPLRAIGEDILYFQWVQRKIKKEGTLFRDPITGAEKIDNEAVDAYAKASRQKRTLVKDYMVIKQMERMAAPGQYKRSRTSRKAIRQGESYAVSEDYIRSLLGKRG